MRATHKTKQQLLEELDSMHKRIRALEASAADRERAAEGLREAEQIYRTVADFAYTWLCWEAPDGTLRYVSPSCERITGYLPGEFIGRPRLVAEIVLPEDGEAWAAHRHRFSTLGTLERLQFRIRRKNGEVRWIEHLCEAVVNREGTFMGRRASNRDITEHKRVEDALRESEAKYSAVVEGAFDGVSIVQDDIIQFVNGSMAQAVGYTVEETVGRRFTDFLVEEQDHIVELTELTQAGIRQPPLHEIRLRCKDGHVKTFEASGTIVQYRGRPAAMATMRDITERKRMEERLLVAERLAALGQFSGGISHELRNSLATIDSSVYYLKTKLKGSDEKVQTHLDRIKGSVQGATAVIQSLLDLTRMKEPNLARLDLRLVAAESIEPDKVPATVNVVRLFAAREVRVNADPEQLRMAFKNIVENAVQAMEGSGTLTVTVGTSPDGKAEASFTDTGPGIPPENLSKVFQPLFSTKTKGMGFGLAIAKMVVDKNGGTIEARSEVGKGATVVIRFPLERGEGAVS